MRKLVLFISLAVFIGCFSLFVLAQESEDYKKHAGYVDYGDLSSFKDAEKTVEIFIKGPLLKFVSKATVNEDPELSDLLDNLLLIKVDVFSVERKQSKKVQSVINKISKKLASKKWERMVRVKDRKEQVEVFTLFDNKYILSGLVVMAIDNHDDEAVFINIVGKIDPEKLGKLSSKFNIPKLDSIEINVKNKGGRK